MNNISMKSIYISLPFFILMSTACVSQDPMPNLLRIMARGATDQETIAKNTVMSIYFAGKCQFEARISRYKLQQRPVIEQSYRAGFRDPKLQVPALMKELDLWWASAEATPTNKADMCDMVDKSLRQMGY